MKMKMRASATPVAGGGRAGHPGANEELNH